MKLARSYGVKTIFNLADPSLVGRNKDIFPRIIGEFVDILICNEDEGRALTSQDEPGSQLSSLASLVFVTRGENGSEVWQGGKCAHIRPYAVSAVDTTGAGDMYAAGVIYGLSQGFSYADSAVIGSFYASRVVQKQGAYVTPEIAEEVKSFISSM